jgi:hypothetical protein
MNSPTLFSKISILSYTFSRTSVFHTIPRLIILKYGFIVIIVYLSIELLNMLSSRAVVSKSGRIQPNWNNN